MSDHDLGTPEAVWRSAEVLAGLPPLLLGRPRHVVVVAPHPDDEVFGVGGLLRQLASAGSDIEIVVVTDGEGSHPNSTRVTRDDMAKRRRRERELALTRLGVQPRRIMSIGLPDGFVEQHPDRLQQAGGAQLRDETVCLAPWRRDGHPDHDAAGRAAAAACREKGSRLVEFLVWAWHWATPTSGHVPWPSAFRAELSRRDVAAKRWAIAAFTSQIRSLGPDAGDAAVLPAPVLARFRRPFEVVLL